MSKKRILFICTHNSARSQIAEGITNARFGDEWEAFSAGTEKTKVNIFAIEVMKELGIDISNHYSKTLDLFLNEIFDLVVTVCDSAKETCPFFPNVNKMIHVGFQDPSIVEGSREKKLIIFRELRDEIHNWLNSNLNNI